MSERTVSQVAAEGTFVFHFFLLLTVSFLSTLVEFCGGLVCLVCVGFVC